MLAFNRVADLKYAYMEAMTAATGTLTSNNTNVSDGDTVTIGSTVYRFKNTMAQANDVQIGASADASMQSLIYAINGAGTPGTDYFAGTTASPDVTAGTLSAHAFTVTAKTAGQAANNVATTKSAATLTWGDVTLDGGAGGKMKDYFIDTAGTYNTDAIDLQAYYEAIAFIKVYSHAGTTPTLDCKIQYSHNYDPQTKIGDWADSGDSFTQITTTNSLTFKKFSSNFGKYVRLVLTLGGTTPQYEVDVAVMGKL